MRPIFEIVSYLISWLIMPIILFIYFFVIVLFFVFTVFNMALNRSEINRIKLLELFFINKAGDRVTEHYKR